VAGAASVGVFVSFASLLVYTFGVLLKPLAGEFGWSRESVSAAFGVAAITVAVCSPPLGYFFDRVNPTRIIVPCLIVFGAAFASLSLLTPHLWHLYAVFFVLGVVGNGTAQMAYTRAVSSWFERRRGAALAIVMSGGALGAVVLPPAAEALIQSIGWRQACMVLGALVIVVGVPIVARFIRERPVDHRTDAILDGATVREGLTSPVFWILVTVLFAQSIAQNGALTHMAALLTDIFSRCFLHSWYSLPVESKQRSNWQSDLSFVHARLRSLERCWGASCSRGTWGRSATTVLQASTTRGRTPRNGSKRICRAVRLSSQKDTDPISWTRQP